MVAVTTAPLKEDSPLLGRNNDHKMKDSTSSVRWAESTKSVSSVLLEKFTKSERGEALRRQGVGPAAFLIRDAVMGEEENLHDGHFDPYDDKENETRSLLSIICGRLTGNRNMVLCLNGTAWILALLSFVEPPCWCRGIPVPDGVTHKFGSCGMLLSAKGPSTDDDNIDDTWVEYYPNSSSMLLTVGQSMALEWILVSIVTMFLLMRLGRDGFQIRRFFRKGMNRLVRTIQCVSVVLLYVGLVTNRTDHHPFVRLVLLASFMTDSHLELFTLFKMLPEIGSIMSLLVVITIFYAWFGVVLFYDTPQGRRDFPNLIDGMWTLWICITTANYPDVMMPSYNEYRLAALYFVSFMIISYFFVMNLVLASVVNAYDGAIEDRKKWRAKLATRNLTQAFHLLDHKNTGRIDRDTIMALFLILNEDFPEFRTLPEEETKLLFGFLDRDGTSLISLDEFQDFGEILLLEFTKASDYATLIETRFPKLFQWPVYQKVCDAVRSPTFELVVDVALILNAVVIAIQTFPQLAGRSVEVDPHVENGYIDTYWELFETMFTFLYLIEVLLKIMVLGWKRYSESPRHMFDFMVTVSAILATAYVYYPNDYSDSRLIRFIVMARVLRLMRLVFAMNQFQLLGIIVVEILPGAINVFLLLFFVMYLFAALGMTLYGGMITRDPSNPLSDLVLKTDFSDNSYWANNFNDMMSGMNVLFNLLVINNWTECEVGFEAVTEGKWVRYFFFSFHIMGVILANNLVVAFIINGFFQQLSTVTKRNVGKAELEGGIVIQGERAKFDGSQVTGTKTGATGEYIARLRSIHSDVEVDEQERLKRLFTQTSNSSLG